VASQAVAPHTGSDVEHAAEQQNPPKQMAVVHMSSATLVDVAAQAPVAIWGAQVPALQKAPWPHALLAVQPPVLPPPLLPAPPDDAPPLGDPPELVAASVEPVEAVALVLPASVEPPVVWPAPVELADPVVAPALVLPPAELEAPLEVVPSTPVLPSPPLAEPLALLPCASPVLARPVAPLPVALLAPAGTQSEPWHASVGGAGRQAAAGSANERIQPDRFTMSPPLPRHRRRSREARPRRQSPSAAR
jgi:hypothetical protein